MNRNDTSAIEAAKNALRSAAGSEDKTAGRTRNDRGRFNDRIELQEVLAALSYLTRTTPASEPVATSGDVADFLGCNRETARQKLHTLADQGDVRRKNAGANGVVWWVADDTEHDVPPHPDRTMVSVGSNTFPAIDYVPLGESEPGALEDDELFFTFDTDELLSVQSAGALSLISQSDQEISTPDGDFSGRIVDVGVGGGGVVGVFVERTGSAGEAAEAAEQRREERADGRALSERLGGSPESGEPRRSTHEDR